MNVNRTGKRQRGRSRLIQSREGNLSCVIRPPLGICVQHFPFATAGRSLSLASFPTSVLLRGREPCSRTIPVKSEAWRRKLSRGYEVG